MGLFDFLKKKQEPVAAPEPVKYKVVLNDLELTEGFPRLTRFEIAEMDDEYYDILDYSEEDPEAAFDAFYELAKKGHPGAMNKIAYAYCLGKGVAENMEENYRWLFRAACFGDAFSMNELAEEYENGYEDDNVIYIEKDPVKSFFWYQKAANQEIYYIEDDEEDEEDEDDDDEPYSPNKRYVEEAQERVDQIIESINNGTFEGTPAQAQQILNMYD